MPADFSRVRLNPLLDYATVELKQGGVLLDADANEGADITHRRLVALASDVLGRSRVSQTTPDAFKISLAADGSLQMGRGRLYVDGLLAENHGASSSDPAKRTFDSLLSEEVFTDPVGYLSQPYFPNPPALPQQGRHLVYLDVWQRSVTHLEQPALVESAVGVETSSRTQVVWQVRVVAEDAGNASCDTPDDEVKGFDIAPSTGRLTTGTFEVAAVDDPCELPPTGGYRGLENQLYRVEIHDPGQPGGGATFKYSRDGGSVGSRVVNMISDSELELETLGRDDVLRFNSGDFVEIVDDSREFSQVSGEIRQITVLDATRRIRFTPPLPSDLLPSPANFPNSTLPPQRHLRVIRWDQKGNVFRTDTSGTPVDLGPIGPSGVIAVPAEGTTLLLENGLTVSFASVGSKGFKAGDYWVFAARTADASVELLDRAPPRGIHHHFERLSIWDVTAQTLTDCRHHWPPAVEGHDCSCTACVTVESHESGQLTLQDAINRAQQTGGTVCIGPGQYRMTDPLRIINATSLRIRGQGPATELIGLVGIVGAGGVFALENCAAVAIENLSIVSSGRNPAISVDTALGLSLKELVVRCVSDTGADVVAIALSGVLFGVTISDCTLVAPVGILAAPPTRPPTTINVPPPAFVLAGALQIEDNAIACQRRGIALSPSVLHALGTRIAGNEIVGCTDTGIGAVGVGLSGASIHVTGNDLQVTGHGIRSSVDGAWIDDNKVVHTGATTPSGGATGIALTTAPIGPGRCQILANQISGFSLAGIDANSATSELIIKLNIVEECGLGIRVSGDPAASSVAIENNQLKNLGGTDPSSGAAIVGIAVSSAETAIVRGNLLRGIAANALQSSLRAGIMTVGVVNVRVSDNDLSDLAPADFLGGPTAGILLVPPFAQFEVNQNRVQRDAVAGTASSVASSWFALNTLDITAQGPVTHVGGFTTVSLDAARTLVLGANRAWVSTFADATIAGAAAAPALTRGAVLGNVFGARGGSPAVHVLTSGECLFSDNRVELVGRGDSAVQLGSSAAVVSANRVRGGVTASIAIAGQPADKPVATVLGNITSGQILVQGQKLGPPWDALNVTRP